MTDLAPAHFLFFKLYFPFKEPKVNRIKETKAEFWKNDFLHASNSKTASRENVWQGRDEGPEFFLSKLPEYK